MLPSAVSDSRVHNILPNKIETDFQFSRASSATRVNHQGLIEDVGYFGPELIQNGDFSELGSELITNGDFSNGLSNWSVNGGSYAQVTGGVLISDNSDNGSWFAEYIGQNISFVNGKTYKITFRAKNLDGDLNLRLTQNSNIIFTQNITSQFADYIVYYIANADNGSIRIFCNDAVGKFAIDNVSVKQVDPDDDWTLGTGWGYGDNKINFSNTTGTECFQSLSTDAGIYKISFDLDITSGTVQSSFSSPSTSTIESFNTSGTKTFNITTSASFNRFRFVGLGNSVFSISNVSVVEVIGDKPRLDYDPTNPTCPHLLLEPQSTNLVTFSIDYSQSDWVKSKSGSNSSLPTVTNDYATSPDGTTNASRVQFDCGSTSSSDYVMINQNISLDGSSTYALSFYIKSNSSENQSLLFFTQSSFGASITATSEWQRVETTFTSNTTNARGFGLVARGSIQQEVDISIFGAQLEQQSFATSYIPTAGAQETRVAETCNSAGNVDTFNSTEGVLYADIARPVNDSVIRSIALSDNSLSDVVLIQYYNNNIGVVVKVGSAVQAVFAVSNTDLNLNKIAISWAVNNFKVYVNGSLAGTDTSGTTFSAGTLTTLSFDNGGGSEDYYGKVKGLATYNRALTDTELYTITSTQYSAYSGMVAALGNYTIPC